MFECSKTAGFEKDKDILFRYSSVSQNSNGGLIKHTAEDQLKDYNKDSSPMKRSPLDVNVDLYTQRRNEEKEVQQRMLRKAAYLVNVNADFVSPRIGAESVLFNKSKFFSFAKLPSHQSGRILDDSSPKNKEAS